MTEGLFLGALSALWFGILTSISPCPLATNIAAMSFIGKRVSSPVKVLLTGALYTLGRMLAYIALGFVVVKGLLSIPGVAQFLQQYMNLLMGPLLIVVGIFLLGVFSFNMPGVPGGERLRALAEKGGYVGTVLLGIIFALTMCPVSAGLFFGSLIPISISCESYLLMPSIYGIGTGLPVIAFAVIIALSAGSIGKVFNRLSQFEFWARRVTGAIFIIVGIYYIINNLKQYGRVFFDMD